MIFVIPLHETPSFEGMAEEALFQPVPRRLSENSLIARVFSDSLLERLRRKFLVDR